MTQGIDGRKGVVFAIVVVVLAAVGVYLTLPSSPGPEGEAGRTGAETTQGAASPSAAPRASGSAAPPADASADPEEFDVYAYLPLSRAQLAAAADVARRFLAQYATHRHDEDPVSYAERLKAFTTNELGASLTRAVTDPDRVRQERADKVVAEGTAKIKSIRAFSGNSITWVATATERVTAASGPREVVEEYAVTVIQVGDAWRVYDLSPAEAGQEGDPAEGLALGGRGVEGRAG